MRFHAHIEVEIDAEDIDEARESADILAVDLQNQYMVDGAFVVNVEQDIE